MLVEARKKKKKSCLKFILGVGGHPTVTGTTVHREPGGPLSWLTDEVNLHFSPLAVCGVEFQSQPNTYYVGAAEEESGLELALPLPSCVPPGR